MLSRDRKHSPAQKLFASLVLVAFASHSVAAHASSRVTVSFEIPQLGALDQFHNAIQSRDPISNSLYALRNAAMEDLINTRKALKVLLADAGQNSSFELPSGVLDLYVFGDHRHAEGAGSARAASPEIADAADWLGKGWVMPDAALRRKMTQGLAFVSAQLVKHDVMIRFLNKDFWDDKKIDQEFYWQHIQPTVNATVPNPMGLPVDVDAIYKSSRSMWMKEHGVDEQVAVLAGHREFLLDRYHLLALEIDGKPLYHHLYEALRLRGFPDPSVKLASTDGKLPQSKDPIPMNETFEEELNSKMERWTTASNTEARWERYSQGVKTLVEGALLEALKSNTDRLEALSSEVHYTGARDSALLELARFPDLWQVARAKYAYLGGAIDFDGTQSQMDAYFARVDKVRRNVRYTTYGVGIGLGVAAMAAAAVASGGTAPAALGAAAPTILATSAQAMFLGSGAVMAGQATIDYVQARSAAQVAKGMFLGSSKIGSAQGMKNALLIEQDAYKSMIISVLMLGLNTGSLSMLARGRSLVAVGGRTMVRMSEAEAGTLAKALTKLESSSVKLAPMGQALLNIARRALGFVIPNSGAIALERAVVQAAKAVGMSPAAAMAKLQSNPMVGGIVTTFKDRMVADPKFLQMMLREQVTNFGVSVASEVAARGWEGFKKENIQVGVDLFGGALITGVLAFISAPTALKSGQLASRTMQNTFDPGFTARERMDFFFGKAKTSFIAGVATNAVAVSAGEGYKWAADKNPDEYTFGDAMANIGVQSVFGGVYSAVSSTIRYQALGAFNRIIAKKLGDGVGKQLVLGSLSTGNNFIGGWGYVKLAKITGVMDSHGNDVELDEDNLDIDRAPDSSAEGLIFQDLGAAYMKITNDSVALGEMFDFLGEN